MKHQHEHISLRGVTSTLALLGVALFTGCGADAAPTTNGTGDDAIAAYAALSAKIQACRDESDACVTAAAGDATKEAACDSTEKACIDKTKAEQKQARADLGRAAAGCFRDGDDDDGGPEGACGRRRHECLRQRTPNESQCLDDLFMCLEKKAGPGPQQDAGLNACVDAAHECVMNSMSQRGGRGGRPGPGGGFGNQSGNQGKGGPSSHAGPGAANGGGFGPGAPGGHAGGPAHVAGAGGAGAGFASGRPGPGGPGQGSHAGGAPAHAAGGAGGSWR